MAQRAADAGLAAIALTDHDTTAGLDECRDACRSHGIDFVNGVEVSARFERREIHIVALGIDPSNQTLQSLLSVIREKRTKRTERILIQLKHVGIDLELPVVNHAQTPGRMHIAKAMVAAGHVSDPQEAFDKYLVKGKPAFVEKGGPKVDEAIAAIHAASGLAFVAHPGIGNLQHDFSRLLLHPFDGIEAYHSRHSPGMTERFSAVASDRGLLVTGGSDCHGGANGPIRIGSVRLPPTDFQRIKDRVSH